MSIATRQKVRVFLEGREVPFISATILSGVNQPTQANIELVPIEGIKYILPRTHVQIFMRDPKNFGDFEYYLIFDGEVLGKSRIKKQDGRAFSITCFDHSQYWDDAKLFLMNPSFVLGMIESTASFKEAPLAQTVKAVGGQAEPVSATVNMRIVELILEKANGSPNTTGKDLMLGCQNVINKLGHGNLFLKLAYDRLKISDRLNVYSSNKVADFLKDLTLEEFLGTLGGSAGGLTSVRELVTSIMSLVFHNFVSVPFPPKTVVNGANKMTNFMFVPEGYTLPPPMCNVIFPNQQIGFSFSEDMRALPTRYMFMGSLPVAASPNTDGAVLPANFYPPSFSDYMSKGHTATATDKNSLLGASTLIKDPKTGRSYADIFYGDPSSKKIDTAVGTVLRIGDFLTNEESIKGIYLARDTFMPAYTALVQNASPEARSAFIQEIGKYTFYKKRYEQKPVSAELIFNPFLVPGFNALFLDDSAAGQSFMASLDTVTHRLSNDGCATIVGLSHGRDFDETDLLSGGQGEPPLPKWFDTSIFGSADDTLFAKETTYLKKVGALVDGRDTAEIAKRNNIKGSATYPNLSKFYQTLLGIGAITNYTAVTTPDSKTSPKPQIVTPRGAVYYLLNIYRNVSNDPVARDKKITQLTKRPMFTMKEAFAYLGASVVGKNGVVPEEYAVFSGARFNGTGYADQSVIAARRSIINDYIKQLRSGVGFKG